MSRTMAYSLNRLAIDNKSDFKLWCLYDAEEHLNEIYLPKEKFRAFNGDKLSFFKNVWQSVRWPDLIILSHINLAIVGLIIKWFNPKCKVWLVAHGIEVWYNLPFIKRTLLNRCDRVVCVSQFTKQQMITRHQVPENKCLVLNNALDPFFIAPKNFAKPAYLTARYGLRAEGKVIFTLSRINSAEQYKGYEKVVNAVAALKKDFPGLKYILAGKSDDLERIKLEQLIASHHLQDDVVLTGFIDEKELTDHFLLADVFAMPSKKEGFGLVLIEAAACGTPVICGNTDGSIDAIKNGELGIGINPDDTSALISAIAGKLVSSPDSKQKKQLHDRCLHYFNSDQYEKKLRQLIFNE